PTPRFIFFFQAEDGIRDFHVTGVQTCALPIFLRRNGRRPLGRRARAAPDAGTGAPPPRPAALATPVRAGDPAGARRLRSQPAIRSEERRVGQGCRPQWTPTKYRTEERQGALTI